MKKPAKIAVTVVAIIAIIGGIGAVTIKSKIDDAKAIVTEASNQTAQVKKGDINVNVVGSGVVVPLDESNPNGDLALNVEIDELDIDKVQVNQSVEIQLDAFPDEVFYGTVQAVAPQGTVVNGVSNFMVRISLPTGIQEIGTVNKDSEIRQGKSTDYISVAKVDKDDVVRIVDEDEDYYKVATEGNIQGYIAKDDIDDVRIKPNQDAIVNKDVVDLQKEANSDSDTINKLVSGDSVTLMDKDGDYYKVKASNGKEGYVNIDDLDVSSIKPGMNASASISVAQKDDILYVPIEAVNKENIDDYYVVLPENSKEKAIDVGIHNEDYIEVTNGLKEGDKVKLPEKKVSLPQGPFGMMPQK